MMQAKPYLQEIHLERDLIDSFEEYPFDIPAIYQLSSLTFHPDVTFIVGENGSGKSTLIEAIALSLGFGLEGGTKNYKIEANPNGSALFNYLTHTKSYKKPSEYYFLRAESLYNVATYLDGLIYPEGYVHHSLHQQSHGESFMAVLNGKLGGKGLYIFDEPEAALSPARQLAALAVIDKLVKKQSQFIIATHSPILLSYPDALIYQLDESGIRKVKYEETEHYMITKHFLNNYEEMLKIILED